MRILQIELIFCLARSINYRYTIVNYFHILKSEIKYKIKIILKFYIMFIFFRNFIVCIYTYIIYIYITITRISWTRENYLL